MKSAVLFIVFSTVVVCWYGLTSVSLAQENRDEKIASLETKINEMQDKYEGQIKTILEQYQKTQQQLEKALNMIEEIKNDGQRQVQGAYTSQPLPEGKRAVVEESRAVSEAQGAGTEGQGLQAFDFPSSGGEDKGGAYDFTELLFDEIKLGPVEWHGRLESRYVNIADDRNVDNIDKVNTFEQSTFALWAGMQITDDIQVLAELEFEPTEESSNEIRLDQARLTWDLIKLPPATKLMPEYERSWGLVEEGILSFTFGKFYYPFGMERFSYSGPVNKLVDRPSPFRQIIPGTYSDVGVKLHGLIPIYKSLSLRHEIALTNGLKGPLREDRQNKDFNNNKQVGGRLGLSLRDWFEVGGSAIVGNYHIGRPDQKSDETLSFFGADMRVTYNKIKLLSSTTEEVLDVRGEYVFNHFNMRKHLKKDRDLDFSREGWYVQASYKLEFHKRFLNYVEPVFRYDSLDDDVRKFAALGEGFENPDNVMRDLEPILEVNRYAFGIGWSPFKHFKIKGEYEISDERGDTPEVENNAFLYEMTIDW